MSPRRLLGCLALVLCFGAVAPRPEPSFAQTSPRPAQKAAPADPVALLKQVSELFKAGKYKEAIPVARRIIAELERMGAGQLPIQAQNFTMLGDLERLAGNPAEAEKQFQASLRLLERIHGPRHPDLIAPLLGLHNLRQATADYADAGKLLARAVAIREATSAPDDPELAWMRVTQARLAQTLGRTEEAAAMLERALAVMRAKLPPEHPYIATTVNNLSQAYVALGRYAEAEPLLDQSVRDMARIAGSQSPLAAVAMNNLASLYRLQGRLTESEALHRKELAIVEAAVGRESIDLVPSLNNLALVLDALQRPKDAEALLRRSESIQQRHRPANHPETATTLSNLATIIGHDGRGAEAIRLLRQAIAMREAHFGPDAVEVAVALLNLSATELETGLPNEALMSAERARRITSAKLAPGHPVAMQALSNVAATLDVLGRTGESQPLHTAALAARQAALGPDHPDVMVSLVNMTANALDRGAWSEAYELSGRATALYDRALGDLETRRSGTEAVDGTLSRSRGAFLARAVAAERLRAERPSDRAALENEAFVALQRDAASDSARALRGALLRVAAGSSALSRLIRERQDAAEARRAREQLLTQALGLDASSRNEANERVLRQQIEQLGRQLASLDARLRTEFPEHANLLRPAPLSIAETQRLLPDGDAVVVLAESRTGSLVFVVTRTATRYVRSDLTGADIAAMTATLRCGLDQSLWVQGKSSHSACAGLNGQRADGSLPFEVATAQALYAGLLAPVADLTQGKRLRVLAQGALATIPLHVLVTEPPRPGAPMTDVAWLARHASISILPSLDSLRLQAQTGASRANKPYFAVANPLLTGADGRDRSAFAREHCNPAALRATGPLSSKAPVPASYPISAARLRPSLDPETLRRQPPLPETADEVCEVASLLGAGSDDVLLGARASRPAVMRLARERRLLDYRVLHLASHGLVAGRDNAIERSLPEPAILLTPPASEAARTSDDTGLLTASDIASFELDADWVVLSACNTAAGGRADAEALSGLARAFFHAGAKGLLVSHWEVNSEAAVRLVTRAFAAWSKDASRSRSDALASAMRELASDPDPRRSHPAYWAPFVVIGAR